MVYYRHDIHHHSGLSLVLLIGFQKFGIFAYAKIRRIKIRK